MLHAWMSELDELIFTYDWEDVIGYEELNHWIYDTVSYFLFGNSKN